MAAQRIGMLSVRLDVARRLVFVSSMVGMALALAITLAVCIVLTVCQTGITHRSRLPTVDTSTLTLLHFEHRATD